MAPAAVFRVGEHPTFDRIVVDAPKGTTYVLNREGTRVALKFSNPMRLKLFQPSLARAGDFAATGADGSAPLTVSFSISPSATIKDFYSGNSIVVDVMGPPLPAQSAQPVPATTAKTAKESPPPEKKETRPEPQQQLITPTPRAPLQNIAPNAVEEQKPAAKKEEVAPTEAKKTEVPLSAPPVANSFPDVPPPAALDKPPVKREDTIAPPPQSAPVPPVHTTEASPPPPVRLFTAPKIAMDPKVVEQIQSIIAERTPAPVAVLDPKVEIGTAIFARGGYVTIVFDRKLAGDALISSPPPRVKLEPLNLPYNTGFRIAVPDTVSVRATRRDTAWEIYLIRAGGEAPLSTEFIAQPEFALGARLLVSTSAPPNPVFFPDPVIGDDLIILPLKETGAFSISRRMSDFQIVPAAQGLVLKPRHERVMVRSVPDGVEITAEGGLKLSPSHDTGLYSSGADGSKKSRAIYALDRWKGGEGLTFAKAKHRVLQTLVDIKEEDRILARLDLARFYFAHGMGYEALSILQVIKEKLPEIEAHPDFLSVRGGARILIGNYQEGLNDLNHQSLRDQTEITLWKAVAAAGLRDWATALDQFAMTMQLLSNYEEPFRSKFMILAIETAVIMGHDQRVTEWVADFEKKGYAPTVEPALRYLKGIVYSKAGRADMAEKYWRMVTRGKDRLYKIRAELALVDLGVATGSLTPKQAVDRLEGLRFAWRGDDLEIDILKRLGGFYMEAKNFRMGFTVLSQVLRLYPQAPQTSILREEMVEQFKDLYLTDMGADLSPIDALSLYTDFKSLIPSGEEGNAVRKNLAERLIDIDLLDQASKLLEDLLKNSQTPQERVSTATRLAAVRLLDHKAEAALTYLDQSKEEASKLPQAVQDERQLLRVRALSEMGKYSEALAALPAGNAKPTKLLKADIAWRAKNWADATKALMDLVGEADPDKPIDEEKASWITNAAIAMARSGDLAGLERLSGDFGPAMEKTSKANLFHILTRPEKMAEMKDLRAAQSKITEVDMFRGILDGYRTSAPEEKK